MPTLTTLFGQDSGYTLSSFRDQIFVELKEDGADPQFWTLSEINNLINEGLRKFCEKAQLFIMYDEVDSVVDQMAYNLPTQVADILGLGYDSIELTKNQIKIEKVDVITKGTPSKWGKFGLGAIFLNPIPDASGKKIFILYSAYHTKLTAETDVLYIADSEIITGLIAYVKYRALSKDGHGQDIIKASKYEKAYHGALDYAILKTHNDEKSYIMGDD